MKSTIGSFNTSDMYEFSPPEQGLSAKNLFQNRLTPRTQRTL